MAPSKLKPPTKPVSKDRVGSDSRVAKRPQRGFHRFKDGSLNVAPKSKEENDILEANQENSSLLRLPAEIRDMIWRYALKGKTFIAICRMNPHTRKIRLAKLKASRKDPKHGTALLRTCRQLFLETASYPMTLGSLSCEDPEVLVAAVKTLKEYQRKQFSRICMSLTFLHVDIFEAIESDWCPQMVRRSLPVAKDLDLRIRRWIDENGNEIDDDKYIESVRADLNKVWRKQDGWNITVRTTAVKKRFSRLK